MRIYPRIGGISGGGGRSGGSSSGGSKGGSSGGSSGGSKGGSSGGSSGSSGSSGKSGSSGSSGSSGTSGSGSSRSISSGKSNGSPMHVASSSSISSSQRSAFYSPTYGYSRYGYGRPGVGAPALLFGFWPVYWYSSAHIDQPANGDSRPGGNLTAAGVTAGNNSTVYVVYGDTDSVNAVVPTLVSKCHAVNQSAPPDLSHNNTIQLYREDSFALFSFNGSAAPRNGTFESCLNDTIGNNLLVQTSDSVQTIGAAGMLVFNPLLLLVFLLGMVTTW